MRLPATCRLADLPALSALSAFIRAARASFLLCLPFALRRTPFILAHRMFVFSFCFAYCPKHLRQYHFLFALSSPIAKIFFFFCLFSYLQAPFPPPFLAVVPGSSQPHTPLRCCSLLPQGIPAPPVTNIVRCMTPLLSAIYPTFPIFNDFDDFMKIILTL